MERWSTLNLVLYLKISVVIPVIMERWSTTEIDESGELVVVIPVIMERWSTIDGKLQDVFVL